jgi:hypothetical protein
LYIISIYIFARSIFFNAQIIFIFFERFSKSNTQRRFADIG